MSEQPEALILAEKLEEAAGDYSQFDRYLGHESAAMLREQHAEIERLRLALTLAVRQNEHDMLMTGEELRQCREALDAAIRARGEKPWPT